MLSVFKMGPTNAFLPREDEETLDDTVDTIPSLGDWDLTLQV
jgi:hypothetical protein